MSATENLSELRRHLVELQSKFRSFVSLSALCTDAHVASIKSASAQLKQQQVLCSKLIARLSVEEGLYRGTANCAQPTALENKISDLARCSMSVFLISLESGIGKAGPFTHVFNPQHIGLQVDFIRPVIRLL